MKGSIEEEVDEIINRKLPISSPSIHTGHVLEGLEVVGKEKISINSICKDESSLIKTFHPAIQTLFDLFEISAKLYPDRDCLGERRRDESGGFETKFTFQNYQTIARRRLDIGSGILECLKRNKFRNEKDLGNFILTTYSINRVEWLLTDFACVAYSIINTALYDTLGQDSTEYILNLTETPIVVCSGDKLDRLLEMKAKGVAHCLISVISMDSFDFGYYQKFEKVGVELLEYSELESLGRRNRKPVVKPSPESLYTLSFTSGTTGPPKGVMLNHSTALAAVTFALFHIPRFISTSRSRYSLSFLPLAHIFERQMSMVSITKGIGVGFPPNGDPALLVQSLRILKPCYLAAVPRVYSRLDSMAKNFLTENPGTTVEQLRREFGMERMEFVLTASAPISAATMSSFASKLGVKFLQLYGCTETYGALMASNGVDFNGSSGPTGCTCEIKLKEVAELGYLAERNNGGELLIRGAQVFQGYYKSEEATKSALDSEGWFHTGDIAKIDHLGRVYIIDRVKHFFKLQQGEYIVPEKIENAYLSSSPLLTQLFVHGDSDRDFLVGVAGIDLKRTRKLLETSHELHQHNVDELVNKPDAELIELLNSSTSLKKLVLQEINGKLSNGTLQGFEKLHNIHLDIEPLQLSDDTITPTIKLKRNNCRTLFRPHLDTLYKQGSLLHSSKL